MQSAGCGLLSHKAGFSPGGLLLGPFFLSILLFVHSSAAAEEIVESPMKDISLFGWGSNDKGQLALGHSSKAVGAPTFSKYPTSIFTNDTIDSGVFEKVALGAKHVLAIDAASMKVYSWGNNDNNQLGLGLNSTLVPFRPYPSQMLLSDGTPLLGRFVAASATESWIISSPDGNLYLASEENEFPSQVTLSGRSTDLAGVSCNKGTCLAWNDKQIWYFNSSLTRQDLTFSNPTSKVVQAVPGETYDDLGMFHNGTHIFAINGAPGLSTVAVHSPECTTSGAWCAMTYNLRTITDIAICDGVYLILASGTLIAFGREDLDPRLWHNTGPMKTLSNAVSLLSEAYMQEIECVGNGTVVARATRNSNGNDMILSFALFNTANYDRTVLGRPSSPITDASFEPSVVVDSIVGHVLGLPIADSAASFMLFTTHAEPMISDYYFPRQDIHPAAAWGIGDVGQLGNGEQILSATEPLNIKLPRHPKDCVLMATSDTSILHCYNRTANTTTFYAVGAVPSYGSTLFFDEMSSGYPDFPSDVATTSTSVVFWNGTIFEVFGPAGGQVETVSNPTGQIPMLSTLQCGYEHCGFLVESTEGNALYLWGRNNENQIADFGPTVVTVNVPYDCGLKASANTFTLGGTFTATFSNSIVFVLGRGSSSVNELEFSVGTVDFISFASGSDHLLVLVKYQGMGTVWGWGDNTYRQAAPSATTAEILTQILDFQGLNMTDIAAVHSTSFAVAASSGFVWVWGRYPKSGLSSPAAEFIVPIDFDSLAVSTFTLPMVSGDILPLCKLCRGKHMMALLSNPMISTSDDFEPTKLRSCWGRNDQGQCGFDGLVSDSILAFQYQAQYSSVGSILDMVSTSHGKTWVLGKATSGSLYVFGPDAEQWYPFTALDPPYGHSYFAEWKSVPFKNAADQPIDIGLISGGPTDRLLIVPSQYPNEIWFLNATDYSHHLIEFTASDILGLFQGPNEVLTVAFKDGTFRSNCSWFNSLPVPTHVKLIEYRDLLNATFYSDKLLVTLKIASGSVSFVNDSNVNGVAAGRNHVAWIRSDSPSKVLLVANNNQYGQLGSSSDFGLAELWDAVLDNSITIDSCQAQFIAASDYTNYLACEDGSVFTWGLNGGHNLFGFWTNLEASYMPLQTPWSAQPLQTTRGIPFSKIFTLHGSTVHITFASIEVIEPVSEVDPVSIGGPSSTPSPSVIACGPAPAGFPPTSTLTCVHGVWFVTGTIIANSSTTIVISSPTVVNGNMSVDDSSTIQLYVPDSDSSSALVVHGCAFIDGTILVELTETQLTQIGRTGGSRQVALISADCGNSRGTTFVATGAKSCRKLKSAAVEQQDGESGSFTLAATFAVDSSKCNTWWIILVSVLGGVVLLVIIVVLLAIFTPLKAVFRPFTKRKAKTASP